MPVSAMAAVPQFRFQRGEQRRVHEGMHDPCSLILQCLQVRASGAAALFTLTQRPRRLLLEWILLLACSRCSQ